MASCEGRTFGDEMGCGAARCDGVKMRKSLFDSVQESCSYHAPSLSVAAWRISEEGFLIGDFSRHFSAADMLI